MSNHNLQLTQQQYNTLMNNDSFINSMENLGITFGQPNFDPYDVNSCVNFVNMQDDSTYNRIINIINTIPYQSAAGRRRKSRKTKKSRKSKKSKKSKKSRKSRK